MNKLQAYLSIKIFFAFVLLTTVGCFGRGLIEPTGVFESPFLLPDGWDMVKGSFFKLNQDQRLRPRDAQCGICFEDKVRSDQLVCCSAYACQTCVDTAWSNKRMCPFCKGFLSRSDYINFKAMLRNGSIELFENSANGSRAMKFKAGKFSGNNLPAAISMDGKRVAILFIENKIIRVYEVQRNSLLDKWGQDLGQGKEVAQLMYYDALKLDNIKTIAFNQNACELALLTTQNSVILFSLPGFVQPKIAPQQPKLPAQRARPQQQGLPAAAPHSFARYFTVKNLILACATVSGCFFARYLFNKFFS